LKVLRGPLTGKRWFALQYIIFRFYQMQLILYTKNNLFLTITKLYIWDIVTNSIDFF